LRHWTYLQKLEKVVSSRQVSGGSITLRTLTEGPAELSNTFSDLVTEVEGTQARTIFGGDASIEVIVSLVSEMESRHSCAVGRINTR
jgi:hypothetical protein